MDVRFAGTHFFNTRPLSPSQKRAVEQAALANPGNTLRRVGEVLVVDTGTTGLTSDADQDLLALGEGYAQGVDGQGHKTRLGGVYESVDNTGDSLDLLEAAAEGLTQDGQGIQSFADIMSL